MCKLYSNKRKKMTKMNWSPHSLIAWHDLAVVNSLSFTLSVVLNAANITDSHLKGEKAATKPAFWMKMTLILSTAQVQLLIHLDSVLLCDCMFRAVVDGGRGAL